MERAGGGATISYALEAEPLGTGGAIAHAVQGWPETPFLAVNGDSYLEIDFGALTAWALADDGMTAGIVVCRVEDVSRYGAVLCEDGIVQRFDEKGAVGPGLINAGVYVLRPSLFPRYRLSGRFSLESDLLQAHVGALRARAYRSDAFFIDIGAPGDFARAQTSILQHTRRR